MPPERAGAICCAAKDEDGRAYGLDGCAYELDGREPNDDGDCGPNVEEDAEPGGRAPLEGTPVIVPCRDPGCDVAVAGELPL
jgi:hypothetical protein